MCLLLQDLIIKRARGVCVFITAGPSTKLFAWGVRGVCLLPRIGIGDGVCVIVFV